MEMPNPHLVKHTEYAMSSGFDDTGSGKIPSDVRVHIDDCDNEDNLLTEKEGVAVEKTVVVIPDDEVEPPTINPHLHGEAKLISPSTGSDQFAIEDHLKNSNKNPSKESTSTMPFFVRKAKSHEILPKPFRHTNQLICVAYLSVLCCCCFGAMAAKWAWKAKLQRNKGLYVVAKKSAKRGMFFMILAWAFGIIFGLINLILYLTGVYN